MINFFGFVHACGGCGTEALGAVELLRSRDVPVRMIVPMDDTIIDEGKPVADYLRSIGVELVAYTPGLFSTCNVLMSFGEHLCLDYIRKYNDRPKYLVYSDCMGYVADNEVTAHQDGLVDEFFFQTDKLARRNAKEIALKSGRDKVPLRYGYKAYLNTASPLRQIDFVSNRDPNEFVVCKITRDDPDKWHDDTWRMFCGVGAPEGVKVTISVLGWGPNAAAKVGDPTKPWCSWKDQMNLTLQTFSVDPKAAIEVLKRSDVLIHVCDPVLEEALGRVFLEAFASGTVVIADNRGGAVELIEDKVTGFLVSSPDEAAFRASEMAYYPERRREIATNALHQFVTNGHGNADVCFAWWKSLIRRSR
jgi:glycosyltransferase involved in cell wall biosynthesis